MEFLSKNSGRVYDVTEAVEPLQTKINKTTDILVIFDWNVKETPVIVDYLFGAHFLSESLNDIQEIITKYEKENNLI